MHRPGLRSEHASVPPQQGACYGGALVKGKEPGAPVVEMRGGLGLLCAEPLHRAGFIYVEALISL